MSKISRGSKGSTSLKVKISAGLSAAFILLSAGGYGLYNFINNLVNGNFQKVPETVPGIVDVDKNIQLGTDSEPLYKTEETVESEEHATFEENETVMSSPSYKELLKNLTVKAQEYCADHRTSLAKMEIVGANNVQVEGSQVLIKGDFKNDTQFGNYIFTMTNDQNPDLKIFNMEGDSIETADFVAAINEVLNDESTTFSLDARVRLVDFSQINKNAVVQNIVKGLENPEEVDNLQDNVDNTSFSLLLNDCVRSEEGYQYSYTLVSYTKEYIYASKFTFTSDKKLTSSALMNKIESHLVNGETTCITATTTTDKFEKSLHKLKHNKASVAQTVATAEETEELSRY